ncbi:MAG TPA: AraD1 family protein [Lacipirellulaceae bacterium]|nr:AraD1 family protein [Lacipirellulaceae bacterium]
MRIVQLTHALDGRRVAIVDEPNLQLLEAPTAVYALAVAALGQNIPLARLVAAAPTAQTIPYDSVYNGHSPWRLLPAFDHPADPAHCLVTGTGLTHRASAENRDRMHEAAASNRLTDSMRMYLSGAEGGRPAAGAVGVQPEWFYKGTGAILRAHGEPLEQPPYACDAGEEPEVAAAYIIAADGQPWRVGFAAGNEFADHVMERQNYLYLAHSKLRECAIGPELVLDESFQSLSGQVTIRRGGSVLWSHAIQSGEEHMAHTLANLEHHHFKYAAHRIAGQAHVHFFGASAFSFGAQVELADGDLMEVAWPALGRPLQNPLRITASPERLVAPQQL